MMTSSNDVNQWCCFDYGSGETSNTDTGNATMNAIYWGTACWFGNCVGSGPWVEADLENGMYHTDPENQPLQRNVPCQPLRISPDAASVYRSPRV